MQIEIIPEHMLSNSDEREIIDLLARAFETDFKGRSYYYQRHHLRIVARDPNIVGHMALLFRAIRQNDRQITIAGLAEVATAPDRRGQGIASTLLNHAIAIVQQSNAQHFLLFGDAALYGAHGFRPVENSISYLAMDKDGKSSIQTNPTDELMVLDIANNVWDGAIPIDLIGRKF